MHEISNCSLCSSDGFKLLWDLPGFPLSETFGKFDPDFPKFDQELLMCENCGHVQLKRQISPSYLYSADNYQFSTAKSKSSLSRFKCLSEFVLKNVSRKPQSVIDIGGNDTSLLDFFDAKFKCLIDPSLTASSEKDDGTLLLKGFIEDVDVTQYQPDVILCSHTLEHISSPVDFFKSLLHSSLDNTLCFVEVPCFIEQVKAMRFDAFFHQHYHYFYPETLAYLVHLAGGDLVQVEYNSYPTCGGSVMIAFKKRENDMRLHTNNTEHSMLQNVFFENLSKFQVFNQNLSKWIQGKRTVYGYGASLLLPVIFYHIGEAASGIKLILDDDDSKNGLTYKNVEGVTVVKDASVKDSDGIIITSYENVRLLSAVINKKHPGRLYEEFNNAFF